MTNSRYEVVANECTEEALVIKDVGHEQHMSVTNDAEAVVAELVAAGCALYATAANEIHGDGTTPPVNVTFAAAGDDLASSGDEE